VAGASFEHVLGLGLVILLCTLLWHRRKGFSRQWEAACAALEEGDLDEAEHLLRQCVKAAPQVAAVRQMLGAVLSRKGKLDEAEEFLQSAVAFEPRNAQALLHLGLFLAMQREGRQEEAVDIFMRAIELDPQTRDVLRSQRTTLAPLLYDERFERLIAPNTSPS